MNQPSTTHFRPGQRHTIYHRPLSMEEIEGSAELVRCERAHDEFHYPGLIVEEWEVRFEGEEATYVRVIVEVAR